MASAALDAVLQSWTFSPWLLGALGFFTVIYLRGWRFLRRRDPEHFSPGRLAAFLAGLGVIFIAIASPLDAFARFLLSVHMVQHLLLMFAAPILIECGYPVLPLLMGLPAALRREWVSPFVRSPGVRAFLGYLTRPVPAWSIFVVSTWLWHAPQLYDATLKYNAIHDLEHACFFYTGLLFWWPVLLPYPARTQTTRWAIIPYLFLAGVQGTALSALLTFAGRVIYPYYEQMPRVSGLSALDDQALAGVIMWIPGSIVYLVPLVSIGMHLVMGYPVPAPHSGLPAGLSTYPAPRPARRPRTAARYDLLKVPGLGALLRWRHARLALQIPVAGLAGLILADGLFGPQVAPLNLAGVVPWIHWRAFLIFGLLLVGNLFCMACPFMLPRRLAKRAGWAHRPWPRALRSKWLAVGLVGLFFWAYEALALWNSPRETALVALAYFVGAFVVDAFFRQAAFCKYVCPIGQFDFVQSFLSPTEIRARDLRVCRVCTTKDCIRGRGPLPGCELQLFQPRKGGNLDCTYCLDCIHACPHDNVGLLPAWPGAELIRDRPRSGVRRFHLRHDLAALVLVLVFAALSNAAGMTAPVLNLRQQWTAALGWRSPIPAATVYILVTLVVAPLVLVLGAGALSRAWSGSRLRVVALATRFAYAFVPLGFTVWLAHYSFHLFTSATAVIPALQRVAGDLGWTVLRSAAGSASPRGPSGTALLEFEILCLDFGLIVSLYVAFRLARGLEPMLGRALRLFAPWAAALLLVFVAGLWIFFQPMQMRGTMAMMMGGPG